MSTSALIKLIKEKIPAKAHILIFSEWAGALSLLKGYLQPAFEGSVICLFTGKIIASELLFIKLFYNSRWYF
jgi:hypothetical protein